MWIFIVSNQIFGKEQKTLRKSSNWMIVKMFVGRSGFEPLKSKDSGFTVRPIWPLWNLPLLTEPLVGIEPTTYWLQISCSTSWAKVAICRYFTCYKPFWFWMVYHASKNCPVFRDGKGKWKLYTAKFWKENFQLVFNTCWQFHFINTQIYLSYPKQMCNEHKNNAYVISPVTLLQQAFQ